MPFLHQLDNADQIWFQCDGASIHRSAETVAAMHRLWPREHTICLSSQASINRGEEDFAQKWSPYSPDLAPNDQFLFGTMKGT